MSIDPTDAERRRAAALEALRSAPSPETDSGSFWQRHGRTISAAAALLLGLWLVSRAVGSFMRNSMSETDRAQEQLRRGLRR